MMQNQERARSTTVYAGLTWDDILGTAVLATALARKGFRVYVDLPTKEELHGLRIVRSYAVGIQPRNGVTFANSAAMVYSRPKRMGYVFRYGEDGRGEVVMKLSTVSSVTEVVREYLYTINADIEVPKQLLDDVVAMGNGGLDRVSRVGRTIYGVCRLKCNDKTARQLLYSYAYSAVNTGNLRLPQEVLNLYAEYEKALKLAETLVKEDRVVSFGPYKVIVISSKHSDELVASNLEYLRPLATDILNQVCRRSSPAFLVYEDESGIHAVRACVKFNVSIAKLVNSIPSEILDKLSVSTSATSVSIEFLDPSTATLERALELVGQIATKLQLKQGGE